MSDKNYEEIYGMFIDHQEAEHEKNQKRIKVGLKVNIFLPLVFLIISFITQGSKLIFLILWIVSLFGISGYLVYVEYSDHKAQERLKEFGVTEMEEPESLIGELATDAEAAVVEKVNNIDDKIEEEQRKIEAEIKERLDTLKKLKERKSSDESKKEDEE